MGHHGDRTRCHGDIRGRIACALFMTVPFLGLAAPSCDAEAAIVDVQREQIETTLGETLADGYREKNIDKFISAYDDNAEIVTYLSGRADVPTLREKTLLDFAVLTGQAVKITLLDILPSEEGVLVLINFATKGILTSGLPANRHDRYYLLMKKKEGRWKILRQSYRKDFGETAHPHTAK